MLGINHKFAINTNGHKVEFNPRRPFYIRCNTSEPVTLTFHVTTQPQSQQEYLTLLSEDGPVDVQVIRSCARGKLPSTKMEVLATETFKTVAQKIKNTVESGSLPMPITPEQVNPSIIAAIEFVYVLIRLCIWAGLAWFNFWWKLLTFSFMTTAMGPTYTCNLMSITGIFALNPWYTRKEVGTQVENVWCPRVGNVSSVEDRACEAIYDLLGEEEVVYVNKANHAPRKKFVKNVNFFVWVVEQILGCFCGRSGPPPSRPDLNKKINVIAYSAGVPTLNQMLIYLHENNIAYLHEKVKGGKKLTDKETHIYASVTDKDSSRYKKHFPRGHDNEEQQGVKISGKSLSDSHPKHTVQLSPDMFEKVVFVSGPFEGVEWVSDGVNLDPKTSSYKKYSFMWFVALASTIYYKIVGDTTGYIPSLYLGQYDKHPQNFVNDGNNLAQDLGDVITTSAKSLEALRIIKLYDIKTLRVITSASVSIGEVEYFRPDADLSMYPYWLAGSRLFTRKHDGVIALKSQTFGLDCNCVDEYACNDTVQCKNCGTVICPVDHATIWNKAGCNQRRDEAWAYIKYFLEGKC